MEVEKKGSKGGFLHLFDWQNKSRKKLFANSTKPSDESNRRKLDNGNLPESQPHIMDRHDTRSNSSNNERSNYSCVSSVSDEEHGNKAPTVVARLMGLDSLPVPTVEEFRVNPFLDSYILESSHRYGHSDNICFPNNLESLPRNYVESRTSRLQKRPIERFQTEMLPPKSAKPISITHNRLLSPIRGPGFAATNNQAYIMEASSRMMEKSPRVVTKRRVLTVGSSSVPLTIHELKEKLDAAHKLSTVGTRKYPIEGQTEKRRTSYSQGTTLATISGKGISNRSNIKGKSSLPVAQEKTNLHKRECSTSSSYSRVSIVHKEKPEAKNRVLKNKVDAQRSVHRETSGSTPKTVLRQNNQKQNCKDNPSSNPSVPNQQGKKVANKFVNKVVVESESGFGSGSKRMGSSASSTEKDFSLSKKRIVTRNKKSPTGYPEKRVCYDMMKSGERPIECNASVDGDTSLNQKKGNDVISFSFSCPIRGYRCIPPSSPSPRREREINHFAGSVGASSTCTTGFNIIDGDSLSVLLEQQLRELSCKLDSSGCGVNQDESLASAFTESSSSTNGVCDSGFISFDDQAHDLNQEFQSIKAKEPRITGSSSDALKRFDHRKPSLTSDLGQSCSGSCSDSRDMINGIKQSLFAQEQKILNWVSSNESYTEEEDHIVFSESASTAASTFIISKEPDNWEILYVKDILNNCQLMLEPFALGKTQDIIPEGLFEHLENHGDPAVSKIERKALFDCVIRCLEFKQEQYFTGSLKGWAKDVILFERKDWLAEELYKEIRGWKTMGDLMVDELVDKDMSSLSGKWTDFENEAFEEGMEIVRLMVSALIDDLICDLLIF